MLVFVATILLYSQQQYRLQSFVVDVDMLKIQSVCSQVVSIACVSGRLKKGAQFIYLHLEILK